jgi:hypothetical protein
MNRLKYTRSRSSWSFIAILTVDGKEDSEVEMFAGKHGMENG